ncbi:protein YgfX [Halomonas sp. GT]|uniref:protein YgfX n=1 Tax=Halomonas sp. GT TaxID=1971364 RepID=UPI001E58EBC4|nr:protein YgfX [Halomonas sp. GT]
MLKIPTTLLIARSKIQCAFHAFLAFGLCALTAWLVSLWIALLAAAAAILLLGREYRYQPIGELRISKNGNQLSAQWLSEEGELENEQPVTADYVSPWLVGLHVGPQRLWLWPDSLPAQSQRSLRRLCHRPGR